MTSMERLGSLLNGVLPDRVPIICNLLDQGAREMQMDIRTYYSRPEYVARGQLAMQKRFGHDNVWAFSYMGSIAELLGCREMIWYSDGPPNVGHMIISSYDDIVRFEVPEDLTHHPRYQAWYELIQMLKNEVSGRIPVFTAMAGSFTLPAILMGMEKWFELLFAGPPDICRLMLQKCSDFNRMLIKSLRASGVDIIAYTNAVASQEFITYDQFRTLALPWIKADMADGGAGLVYYNGGGRINAHIDTLIQETPCRAFHINPKDDVAEAKSIIAGRGLSSGTINDIGLISWSEEEIRNEVKRIMDAGAPGGGFIFGTLVMPFAIPDASIKCMIDSAIEFGDYQRFV